jgi:hypothetical protein
MNTLVYHILFMTLTGTAISSQVQTFQKYDDFIFEPIAQSCEYPRWFSRKRAFRAHGDIYCRSKVTASISDSSSTRKQIRKKRPASLYNAIFLLLRDRAIPVKWSATFNR